MKSRPRFSFSVASAIFILLLLCFAPGALGQGTVKGGVGSSGIVLSRTLPGVFVFAPGEDLRRPEHRGGGCSAQDRGRDSGNCTAVPEGGTAFAYLSLVALGCLATGIFRIRRQARLRENR